jgi:hypothetical protein
MNNYKNKIKEMMIRTIIIIIKLMDHLFIDVVKELLVKIRKIFKDSE